MCSSDSIEGMCFDQINEGQQALLRVREIDYRAEEARASPRQWVAAAPNPRTEGCGGDLQIVRCFGNSIGGCLPWRQLEPLFSPIFCHTDVGLHLTYPIAQLAKHQFRILSGVVWWAQSPHPSRGSLADSLCVR